MQHFVELVMCVLDGVRCVRWNGSGDRLASASVVSTIKLLDVKAEKAVYVGSTSDKST